MAEVSRVWDGTTIGDATAAPYDAATEFSEILRDLGAVGVANAGAVLRVAGSAGGLAVTGATTPVSVAAGRAFVYGAWYSNTATVTVSIPTPITLTRVDLIVLRKDWVNQTVRITRIAGTEGAGAPSLVQIAGTTWDIPLASCSVTVGGAITVTDLRDPPRGATFVPNLSGALPSDNVTIGAFGTVTHTIVGLPPQAIAAVLRLQPGVPTGGNASFWYVAPDTVPVDNRVFAQYSPGAIVTATGNLTLPGYIAEIIIPITVASSVVFLQLGATNLVITIGLVGYYVLS